MHHGPQRHAWDWHADHHPDYRRAGLLVAVDPEDRQVERLARPEPDYVAHVIGAIVTGRGMGEDGQPGAIDREPGRHLAEPRGGHGDLARAARVRADRRRVKMAE